uniref:EF-hand domain-containing protein n=1 Tax=Coccolithus braarudii TaxID=221442 RepID=A0A7S0LRG3_9EUKA
MSAVLALLPTATLCFVVPALPPQRHTPSYSTPMLVLAPVELRVASVSMISESGNAAIDELCDVVPDVCADVEADADAIFTIIDQNGDGEISMAELGEHLQKAGYNEAAVQVIYDKLDIDANGDISREELRAGFLKYTPLREAPGLGGYNSKFVAEINADADALFAAIDTDGGGTISKEELRNHLKEFSKYSFKAISKLFKLLDVNKDGQIEAQELRDAFVKYSALRLAIGDGPNYK